MTFSYSFLRKTAFICFVVTVNMLYAKGTAEEGKTLFTANCASCHNKDMKSDMTGPALGGAEVRWDSKANLYSWIRNSQGMIKKGHPRAVELWNKYKSVMTAFPTLKDDEIESILLFIDCKYNGTCGGSAVPATNNVQVGVEANSSMKWMYYGLVAALALIAYLLSVLIGNMNRVASAKDGRPYRERSLFQRLTSKTSISFLVFAAVILGGYTTVTRAVNFGRQQSYMPDQPIKFSHVTHAGENKIDCQYCHDGARRSKNSVIPATNTCMNCHKAIKYGSKYGTGEITKIFASIGFNPTSGKYIENYEKLNNDSIKSIFTKWISSEYLTQNKLSYLDDTGKKIVDDQWKSIVSSLTSKVDNRIQGPIEWTRIHNLPDHVYFNHSQHVNIGKISCQTCHGPVEKMETVAQHAPLSMGWCVNCHRQTDVKFKDNAYYSKYTTLHEELKSGKRDKVTVADIGGLECQKCHY